MQQEKQPLQDNSNDQTLDNEEEKQQTNTLSTTLKTIWSKKYYFGTYGIVFLFLGIFFALPSVIFNELIIQLNVSKEKMGSIYTYFSISGAIFCLLSGYIVDKMKNIHYLMAIFCILGSIIISLIYFVNNFIIMIFIWIIMASVQYFVEVSIVVLVFRVFNIDGAFLVAFYYFIATISSAIVAPLFNAFNTMENGNYSYSMYILSLLGLISGILLIILPTPNKNNLINDIENIKNEIVQNQNINNIGVNEIETYKINNTKIKYSKKYLSTIYIQTECARNPAIIRELNKCCKQCPTSNNKENKVLYNLFISNTNTVHPYIINNDIDSNIVDDSYWFNFEQKYKKKTGNDSASKQKNVTNLFAIIAVLNVFIRIIQRVAFNAYIVPVVNEYFLFSSSMGYYLITVFWIGAVTGRLLTIYVVKQFKPENIMIFFSCYMVVNSLLFLVLLFVNEFDMDDLVRVLLYFVAFQGGLSVTPLHSANLAFLSNIQPITGILSAFILVAEAIGRGVSALICAFIIDSTGFEAQIYIHLTCSVLVALLMGTNKIRYMFFQKNIGNK